MRLGELLNARWADVDEANQLISVIKTKNDKPRLIPLTKRALGILRRLRQDAPDDELIYDPQRTRRKRRQLMVCFERAVEASGIDDFHDLRHTFATRLRAANVHEYGIADLLGALDDAGRDPQHQGHARLRARRPVETQGRCKQLGGG